MFYNNLTEDIICLIEDFTGPNCWKIYFSSKVLPRLNKGWKLVGSTQTYDDYLGGEPCANCYAYGNGYDIGCQNHESICDNNMTLWMSRDEFYYEDYWKSYFSNWVIHNIKNT